MKNDEQGEVPDIVHFIQEYGDQTPAQHHKRAMRDALCPDKSHDRTIIEPASRMKIWLRKLFRGNVEG